MIVLADLLSARFDEVSPEAFYRSVFPLGSLEERGTYEDGRYTGVIVELLPGRRVMRHSLTDDLGKVVEVCSRDNFCLTSPISYAGKSRRSSNARELFALAIDLDGVETEDGFGFLMTQIERGEEMRSFVWGLPRPTYIVASGTGMHLYYVLAEPVRLFPSTVKELEKLKKRLTWQAWTQGASELHDSVQYESLFQGFRMVGTATKVGTRARAFEVGGKVDVGYLNEFVPDQYRASLPGHQSRLTLEEARERYPEWYQRRIVDGAPKGTWVCKRDLYDWWIRRLRDGAEQGHRYWCLMTLAVYAKKSGIGYDELASDALDLVDFLDSIGDGSDPFTEADALDALEAYNDSYITYPIDAIEARTGIKIEKNKRNYRPQEVHLKIARFARDLNYDTPGGWRVGGGRPKGSGTKRNLVRGYALEHPDASHSQIARALGVSRPTVIKWLKPGWREEWDEEHGPRIVSGRLSVSAALAGAEVDVVRDGNGPGFDALVFHRTQGAGGEEGAAHERQ